MKKAIVLLIAVILFSGVKSFANRSLEPQKVEPMAAEIITEFYHKSLKKDENKACYRDYYYTKGEAYYCLTYNKNERNKLKGRENCLKNGECGSKVEDVYTFYRNGKLKTYLYWYEDGKIKPVKVTYKYDRNGQIKSEKEKDKSTTRILGDTVVTYKYEGDTQTQTIVERKLDFPPIFKREKVLETKINDCREVDCHYAQSFLPQLVRPKK